MSLTDVNVRNAKLRVKDYKLYDGDGLYLLVAATGGKRWRFKYRFDGKEKLLSLGTYPERSLADARQDRDAARKQVAAGIDPGEFKKAKKAAREEVNANSFEVVAREWHNKFRVSWTEGHAKRTLDRLERDLFPWMGSHPISELKPCDLLQVLQRIEKRGALETAHRARSCCGQVFRYAVATGRAERDISSDLRGALPPVRAKHHAAIINPTEVGHLLRAIDGFEGSFPMACALKLAPMLFVRPGELRHMEWSEIALESSLLNDPQWCIPAEKMKMKQPHIVPLSRQAVKILKELQPLTKNSRYVFPSNRSYDRPMSENTLNVAIRRLGYTKEEMTAHGFRAMAKTILEEGEGLQFRPDFIEHQLAHAVKDPNGRAYNRTSHLAERRKMMQVWADYLDGLKQGAKVIPLKREAA